jgi:hypothetical protein
MTKRVRAYARGPSELARLHWAGCTISRHRDFIINSRMRSRVKRLAGKRKRPPAFALRRAGGLLAGWIVHPTKCRKCS